MGSHEIDRTSERNLAQLNKSNAYGMFDGLAIHNTFLFCSVYVV